MNKKNDKPICQNCMNYKRPCCYIVEEVKFVPRKGTCEWFKRKKK